MQTSTTKELINGDWGEYSKGKMSATAAIRILLTLKREKIKKKVDCCGLGAILAFLTLVFWGSVNNYKKKGAS